MGFCLVNFMICDNQPHTISIVKVKDSNEILGGYNPIGWKPEDRFGITNDSFIFSFKGKINIEENNILSRVKHVKQAINHWDRGPSFGYSDFILFNENIDNSCYCKKRSY